MNSGIERQYRVLVAFEGWHVGDTFTTTPTVRLSALVASGYLTQVILNPAEIPTVAAQNKLAAAVAPPVVKRPRAKAARGSDDSAGFTDAGSYIAAEYGTLSTSYDSGSSSSSSSYDSGSSYSGGGE